MEFNFENMEIVSEGNDYDCETSCDSNGSEGCGCD